MHHSILYLYLYIYIYIYTSVTPCISMHVGRESRVKSDWAQRHIDLWLRIVISSGDFERHFRTVLLKSCLDWHYRKTQANAKTTAQVNNETDTNTKDTQKSRNENETRRRSKHMQTQSRKRQRKKTQKQKHRFRAALSSAKRPGSWSEQLFSLWCRLG